MRSMNVRAVAPLALILAAGPMLPGCFHAAAKTVAEAPPLEMPAPPPRLVEAVEPPAPQPLPLVEEPARQPIQSARPPARPEAVRQEAKPEAKPEPAAEQAKSAEEAPKPAPTLQTTPAAAEGEVERRIRVVMARATSDLGRVNSASLNAEARNQYDTAKRFLQQADAELRTTRNLVFAANLAEKAAALAVQLAGR